MAVYFVRVMPDGPIKVGYSDLNVAGRLLELQTGCPYELRIIATIPPGTRELEREIHALFSHLWIQGEWFAAKSDLLDFIDRSAIPHEPPEMPVLDPLLASSIPLPSVSPIQAAEFYQMWADLADRYMIDFLAGRTIPEIARSNGVTTTVVISELKSLAKKVAKREKRLEAIKGITDKHLAERERVGLLTVVLTPQKT